MIRECGKSLTVLRVEGPEVWASRGYGMFVSRDGGCTWEEEGRAEVPRWRRTLEAHPLVRQILRGGISCVIPLGDGARLCVAAGRILRAEPGSSVYNTTFRFPKGSRPLNICVDPNGGLYWGEYFLNLRRSEPVHIYGSEDGGRTWVVLHAFPRGAVCHVHRIVHDPYEESILVCMGDRDSEVAVLSTRDGFRTFRTLAQGNQLYRTACMIPRPSCIVYGTDWPSGENCVVALDRHTGRADKVQQVSGPVMYGCEVGDQIAFSTMVEKQHHEATLWIGDEKGFARAAHFQTRKVNRVWRELTGYPRLVLPEGRGDGAALFFTPLGVKEHSGSLLKMDLSRKEELGSMGAVGGPLPPCGIGEVDAPGGLRPVGRISTGSGAC